MKILIATLVAILVVASEAHHPQVMVAHKPLHAPVPKGYAHAPVPKAHPHVVHAAPVHSDEHHSLTSAEIEDKYNPVVQELENGQHKLSYTGADGKQQCLVCNPFASECSCTQVVGIRCELKRLAKKLQRLKELAESAHHGQRAL